MPRALQSFTVRAQLPEALSDLREIAMNLRWCWDARSQDLFRWGDPEAWEASGGDPMRLLGMIGKERLESLARDRSFLAFLHEVHDDLQHHLGRPRWFAERSDLALESVAYFSPEFGIDAALPQYSGGLGVLAGDHVKAAGSLGLPLVGVGHRLRQEILLGIGGVRALEGVGRTPQVFHINEGHAGFLALERLRVLIRRDGLTFAEAIEAVRAGAVFTTHTPVSAGIDRFPRALIERYFAGWGEECGVAFSDLMELGLEPGGSGELFNMAVLSFPLSRYCHGVFPPHRQNSQHPVPHLLPRHSLRPNP